jgi:hypothetical protein
MMNSLVYHLDQPTNQPSQPNQLIDRVRVTDPVPARSRANPALTDRADPTLTNPPTTCYSVILRFESVILLQWPAILLIHFC